MLGECQIKDGGGEMPPPTTLPRRGRQVATVGSGCASSPRGGTRASPSSSLTHNLFVDASAVSLLVTSKRRKEKIPWPTQFPSIDSTVGAVVLDLFSPTNLLSTNSRKRFFSGREVQELLILYDRKRSYVMIDSLLAVLCRAPSTPLSGSFGPPLRHQKSLLWGAQGWSEGTTGGVLSCGA